MWPTMNARFPQDDTEESLEGTAAHWVSNELCAGRIHREGSLSPNNIMITDEMLDGAELVLDTIRERNRAGNTVHVEERVSIPIHEDCFGTPDYWWFNVGAAHLDITDYKYGHGFVDEWWNPQGLLYMLGILEKLKAQISNHLLVTVSFTIVQPRCFYRGAQVRTHNYTVQEAAEQLVTMQRAAQAAMDPKPRALTGMYCDHCPGRHACDALQEAAYHDAEFASDRVPVVLSSEAASRELRMLKRAWERLGVRVEALEEQTLAYAKAGKRTPHHRIEHGRGRQHWKPGVSPDQIILLGEMLGKNLRKDAVITPAQAKKIGIDESVISAYSAITPGSAKLMPENNADAIRAFGIGDPK